MTWKQIKGYEDYEVSDTGLVRSLKRGKKKILAPAKNGRTGYLHVNLHKDGKRKCLLVHRLVAEAFVPNPQNLPTVNHRDENKLNNEASNLEWLTTAENNRYGTRDLRIALTLRNRPDVSKQVIQLDKFGKVVSQFSSMSEAARQTGIAWSGISQACNGWYKTAGGYFWKFA